MSMIDQLLRQYGLRMRPNATPAQVAATMRLLMRRMRGDVPAWPIRSSQPAGPLEAAPPDEKVSDMHDPITMALAAQSKFAQAKNGTADPTLNKLAAGLEDLALAVKAIAEKQAKQG